MHMALFDQSLVRGEFQQVMLYQAYIDLCLIALLGQHVASL